MRAFTSFFIGLLVALGSPSRASEDRLALLMSEDFARQAELQLAACDRAEALILALRGIPDDPTEEDFARFEQARIMLFRAVASRAFRIDSSGYHLVAISPTGSRVAIGGFGGGQSGGDANLPYGLYDPQTGERVADLLESEIAYASGEIHNPWPPRFSPDGRVVAVRGMMDARTYFYDGVTGAPIDVLSGPPADTAHGVLGTDLGFSPDGTRHATLASGTLTIWDAQSGEIVESYDVSGGGDVIWPLGWTHDGAILARGAPPVPEPGVPPRAWLERWGDGVRQVVLDISAIPGADDLGASGPVSTHTPHLILSTHANRHFLINHADGNWREISGSSGFLSFVREGSAIAVLSGSGAAGGVQSLVVEDIAGTRLTPSERDYLPLDRRICDLSGEMIGMQPVEIVLHTYEAAEVPTGKALYDWVWENVPEHVRAAVAEDRVAKP